MSTPSEYDDQPQQPAQPPDIVDAEGVDAAHEKWDELVEPIDGLLRADDVEGALEQLAEAATAAIELLEARDPGSATVAITQELLTTLIACETKAREPIAGIESATIREEVQQVLSILPRIFDEARRTAAQQLGEPWPVGATDATQGGSRAAVTNPRALGRLSGIRRRSSAPPGPAASQASGRRTVISGGRASGGRGTSQVNTFGADGSYSSTVDVPRPANGAQPMACAVGSTFVFAHAVTTDVADAADIGNPRDPVLSPPNPLTHHQIDVDKAMASLEFARQQDGTWHLPPGTVFGDVQLPDGAVVDDIRTDDDGLLWLKLKERARAESMDGQSDLHHVEFIGTSSPTMRIGAAPDAGRIRGAGRVAHPRPSRASRQHGPSGGLGGVR